MFCSNCGKENDDGTQFCVHCGSKSILPQPPVKKPGVSGHMVQQNQQRQNQQSEKLRQIGPDRGVACQICGQSDKPLKFRRLVRYHGFFMTAYYQTIDGYICTGCATKSLIKYWLISLPSLILQPGWGAILAPWTFLKNITNVAFGKPFIGEYEKAMMVSEDDLSSSDRDFPRLKAERLFDLGTRYWQAKDVENARFYYAQAIKFGTKKIEAYLNYGNSMLNTGNYDSALNATNAAIELFPQSAELYLLRGRVNANSTDKNSAIEDLNRSEALGSTSPELYFTRAQLFEKRGYHDKAISDWRSVLRLASDATMVQEAQVRLRKLEKTT